MSSAQAQTEEHERADVVIAGGGLAGISAASVLGEQGLRVLLLESRPRLGGRASSFPDRESGDAIDNCQHVSMGCCSNFQVLSERLGFADLFSVQKQLTFIGPAPKSSSVPFAAAPLPAPLHLGCNLLRMPWFDARQKLVIGRGLWRLARLQTSHDRPFADWLTENGQTPEIQRRFWHVVLVSALSESLERISLQHARKVFVDGFLRNRSGWEVAVPTVPLDEIHATRILPALRERRVEVRLRTGVERIEVADGRVVCVVIRDGRRIGADQFILAVPHWRLSPLLPPSLAESTQVRRLDRLETAPISSVHLWYDRPLTDLPHAAFVDRVSQWMFHRSRLGTRRRESEDHADENAAASYLQVVISNSRDVVQRGSAEVIDTVDTELREIWPGDARLLRARLVTEHRAVFAPLPHVDRWRPEQQSAIPNLQLAGDWTQTGWPSTMEGAVRSGFLAAQNVLRQLNRDTQVLAGDAPSSWLSRCLFPL